MPTSYTWTLPSSSVGTGVSADDIDLQIDRLYGHDFYYDINGSSGQDLAVTPGGDWLVVTGQVALRQRLLRRFITKPGEWATKPNYGAGAGEFVRKANSSANRSLLANRLREQCLADRAVEAVQAVTVDRAGGGLVKFMLSIKPRGITLKHLDIAATIE